jgi:hypothetical protein
MIHMTIPILPSQTTSGESVVHGSDRCHLIPLVPLCHSNPEGDIGDFIVTPPFISPGDYMLEGDSGTGPTQGPLDT